MEGSIVVGLPHVSVAVECCSWQLGAINTDDSLRLMHLLWFVMVSCILSIEMNHCNLALTYLLDYIVCKKIKCELNSNN